MSPGHPLQSRIVSGTRVGYARCSTDEQDLTTQREALLALGVAPERLYLDHGLTGTTRARPGLDQALAAVRARRAAPGAASAPRPAGCQRRAHLVRADPRHPRRHQRALADPAAAGRRGSDHP